MKHIIALSICLAAALFAAPYSTNEWRVRPWEIIQGLKPRGVQLWRLDQDGIDGWKVSGCDSAIDTTDLTKLWGEKVARVSFTKEGANINVTAPKPIAIPADSDGLEIWLFGPAGKGFGSKPRISILLADANGKSHRIFATGCGSRWDAKRWWGTAAIVFPKDLERPLQLRGFALHKLVLKGEEDFFCFDQINAFQLGKFDIPDTTKMDLGFPTTPDTILPTSAAPGSKNAIVQEGASWLLTYTGKDAKVTYRYTPKSGALTDLTATYNDGKPFWPAIHGGPRAKVGDVEFFPGATIQPTLKSCKVIDDRLVAEWRWEKEGKSLEFTYRLAVQGKSIVVEASSSQLDITNFDAGVVSGVAKPQLFAMTYLNNRWNYPRLLATPDFLASAFCDWYTSNASYCIEGTPSFGLQGADVIDATSARIMGGTAYFRKTDGKLNPLYERFIFTVSAELDDILPNIPNPVSKFRDEMSRLVGHTRAYVLQGSPNHADQELAFWTKMKAYGIVDLYLHLHSGLFRTPLENNRTTLEMQASMSNGGDATVLKLVDGLRSLFPRIGVYQDNRIIAPNDPQFDYGLVSRSASGQFVEGWDGCFRPKPSVMLTLSQAFFPKFLDRFHFNAEYLDELTNAPPWADVDFDAEAPGAGTFSRVIRDYGAVALQHRRLFNGPIWSEGCAAFFWAGLLDTNYAVSNDTKLGLPLIVDFKLRKILPLETFNGADWPLLHNRDVDCLIATEIAEGNIGHLFTADRYQQGLAARIDMTLLDRFLKSYFMIRQVQEQFCASPVAEIKYFVDGKLMSASEMLRAGKTSQNRIYARYENGLETWVNRAAEGNWTIEVDGEEFVLPPSGHYANRPDVLLQYSILVDGRRVDYSQGSQYTYVNGGGVPFTFPEITAAGPYLLRKRGDSTLLTPVPFLKGELVKDLTARQATPCALDEKPLAPAAALSTIDNGADLHIDGKAFHYLLK